MNEKDFEYYTQVDTEETENTEGDIVKDDTTILKTIEDIKALRTTEERTQAINNILAVLKNKNFQWKNTKSFKEEAGVEFPYSNLKQYVKSFNYHIDEENYLCVEGPEKIDTEEIQPPNVKKIQLLMEYITNTQKNGEKFVKTTHMVSEDTKDKLDQLVKKYNAFKSPQVLNAVIMEGIKAFM